ncbi:MAG: hypothetical protein R3E32_21225 [Chitinophagales bacterium]
MFSKDSTSTDSLSSKLHTLILKAVRQFAQKKHFQLSATEEQLFTKIISENILPQWKILATQKQDANPLTLFLVLTKRTLKEIGDSTNNRFDQQLLQSKSTHLAVKYQPLISYLAATTTSGNIDYKEVNQEVSEKFLKKIHAGKLQEQYYGEASVRTFLNKVIRNLVIDCLRSMKSKNRKTTTVEINAEITPERGFDMALLVHNPVFQQHLKQLENALKLFKKRNRFEFCLQILYRHLLTAAIVRQHYPNCSDDLLIEVLSCFVKDYTDLPRGELYVILYNFVCQLEEIASKGTPDSLRKWFERHRTVVWNSIFDTDLQNLGKEEQKMKDWYFEVLVYHYYEI